MQVDNQALHASGWSTWLEMTRFGPARGWLRLLMEDQLWEIKLLGTISSTLGVRRCEGTITWELAKSLPQAQTIGIDFSKAGIDCARARLGFVSRRHRSSRHETPQ